MVQDVRAARRFLSSRSDVTPARIGIAGASIGASLAALAAADDPSVVSLALLSPSLDYRGLRLDAAVKKYGARPHPPRRERRRWVCGAVDARAAEGRRRACREVVVLSRAGHGTAMLTGDADLGRRLLEWFRRTLL